MAIPEGLKEYAKQLGFPGSETLGRIFQLLYKDGDELNIVQALPGTADDIAKKTGLPQNRVSEILHNLLMKGYISVDFKNLTVFRRFPAMIELRDSSVLGADKPEELFVLWERLVQTESANMVSKLIESKVNPIVRVIPVEHTIESKNTVLDVDSARKIFRDADLITAIPCVCRTVAKKNGRGQNCPAPENSVCMQTNFFAAGIMARQIGEVITKEDALKRIGDAEDAGLVHVVRNNVQKDMFMCNCCSCCCTGFFFLRQLNYTDTMAPSRFRVKLDEDTCTGCGICEDRCPFKAITVNGVAAVDLQKCYGCGNCASVCEAKALTLEEIRPVESVRVK